jgi:hypothetical protein
MKEVLRIENVVRGRRGRLKKASKSNIKGYFIITISTNTDMLRTALINFILQSNNTSFIEIIKEMKGINQILRKNFKINVKELYLKNYNFNYKNESFRNVLERKESEANKILATFNQDKIVQLESIVNLIKENNRLEDGKNLQAQNNVKVFYGTNKNERFMVEGALMSKINLILSDSSLDANSKQVGIEKLCLEYDLEWFKQELKNSVDTRSVILHDIYKNLELSLKYITKSYIKNDWLKFKKKLESANKKIGTEKDIDLNHKVFDELKAIIILLVLGTDNVISTSFKSIIELISKSEEAMEADRTEILFKVGERLFRFAMFKLNLFNNILNKVSKDEIKGYQKEQFEIFKEMN